MYGGRPILLLYEEQEIPNSLLVSGSCPKLWNEFSSLFLTSKLAYFFPTDPSLLLKFYYTNITINTLTGRPKPFWKLCCSRRSDNSCVGRVVMLDPLMSQLLSEPHESAQRNEAHACLPRDVPTSRVYKATVRGVALPSNWVSFSRHWDWTQSAGIACNFF